MVQDGRPRRPMIGLTVARALPRRPENLSIPRTYSDAIVAAGGVPVLIPPMEDGGALRQLLSTLDGVLFPGGRDVQPSIYGESAHPTTQVDSVLDALELEVAAWALAEDVPTLGICRGQQLINVVLGGSLIQDLPAAGISGHWQAEPASEPSHPMDLAADSRLAEIVGAASLRVNSFHHQAINRLGRGLRAVGWSPDGVIEAVEGTDHPWLLAVQFHPEDLVGLHEPSRRLFRAFVETCRSSIRSDAGARVRTLGGV